MAEAERVSQTVMTPVQAEEVGFSVSLPGLDLATLIQMASSQGQRLIVRVGSQQHEGLLYFASGRLVHATADGFAGEPAVRRMLLWSGGDFQVCERPWPSQPSIHTSIEALLLRAAHSRDEDVRQSQVPVPLVPPVRALPSRDVLPTEPPVSSMSPVSSLPHVPSVSAASTTVAGTGPRAVTMRREPPPIPPPPALYPPSSTAPLAPVPSVASVAPVAPVARAESAIVASVRVSEDGQVTTGHGDGEALSQLVSYTVRLATLAGAHLGLGPLDALYADLGDRRVVVFNDDGDTVGLVLTPGSTVNDLRRQLGV